MVVCGENHRNPVLLWVHGGPGMPDYLLTKQYPTNLEDLFTVVWWDQRGTALSYDANIPPETMTIEQIICDTLAVTDYLRQRFNQEKIYLLGHSWGSLIAIQAAFRSPERYHAYLGMAQMVYQLRSEKIAYDYMLAEYRKRGEARMVRDLEAAPISMTTGTPEAYLKVRDKANASARSWHRPRHEVGDHRTVPAVLDVRPVYPAREGHPVAGPSILAPLRIVGPADLDRPTQDGSQIGDPRLLLGRQVRLHVRH